MKRERNHTRRRTSDYYLVYHSDSDQIIGRVANVSMGGLMVVAGEPLSVRRIYKLKLVLPKRLIDKDCITFTAESRWSKFNDHAEWWEIGFELREIAPDDVSVLQRIIQKLMMDESDQLSNKEPLKPKAAPKLEYIKTR